MCAGFVHLGDDRFLHNKDFIANISLKEAEMIFLIPWKLLLAHVPSLKCGSAVIFDMSRLFQPSQEWIQLHGWPDWQPLHSGGDAAL